MDLTCQLDFDSSRRRPYSFPVRQIESQNWFVASLAGRMVDQIVDRSGTALALHRLFLHVPVYMRQLQNLGSVNSNNRCPVGLVASC